MAEKHLRSLLERHAIYTDRCVCVYRSYWVVDMAWTHNDLLLAVIDAQGCVGLVPRLGEPLLIQTRGCGIDIGPMFFLPLLPLISIQ